MRVGGATRFCPDSYNILAKPGVEPHEKAQGGGAFLQDSENLKKTSWLVLKKSNCHSKSDFSTMTLYFSKCHGCVTTMTS